MFNHNKIIADQIAWIKSGKIGCVFASALVKMHDKIGWEFEVVDGAVEERSWTHVWNSLPKDVFLVSLLFPERDIYYVKQWALRNGFYLETITGTDVHEDGSNDVFEGLRITMPEGVAWVQYFGPDSHVKTRQSPYPMLMFTVKLPAHIYAKTMVKGILHLAHASIQYLSPKKCETLWNQSYAATKKILGHSPVSPREAAKTTYVQYEKDPHHRSSTTS